MEKLTCYVVRLEDLDEDVFRIILTELVGHRLPLSFVSHSFRALCMPLIFRHIEWSELERTLPTPPASI